MKRERWKNFWKKFWFIVWKDESFKGWIISIIFLFVLVKFIFFPFLSLATGTSLPLAIVESCSMYHEGNVFSDYDSWWQNHESKYFGFEVTKQNFENFIFKNGFSKGDILFIAKANPDKLVVGDVIIFDGERKNPIIHRVIEISEDSEQRTFSTIGDNNDEQLHIELDIRENQLIGKAVFRITPWIGWGKLIFYEGLRPQSERGFCQER